MGQVVYLGLCLLGCLVFNRSVEGAENVTVAARAQCLPGAFYYKRFCYQFLNKYLTWNDAEVSCQGTKSSESHLASILSPREARIVLSYLKQKGISTCIWIGLEGDEYFDWEWSDESAFVGSLWDGRRPSTSYSSNQCVCLRSDQYSGSLIWEQRSCSNSLPYLCKYEAGY